jgi:valyl-tRNA synthetase
VTVPLDRGMLRRLADLVARATAALEEYDYAAALRETETVFWWFCDDYIELVKRRRSGEDAAAGSATRAGQIALSVLLRLFAPVLPFVTEEVWSWWRDGSIHRAAWPVVDEIDAVLRETGSEVGAEVEQQLIVDASAVTAAIRQERSLQKQGFRVPMIATLTLPQPYAAHWADIAPDVVAGNNVTVGAVTFGEALHVALEPAPEVPDQPDAGRPS